MRIIDITHPPQSLWIGREGENTFRPVSFECANWFSAYPDATIAAYYQPYGAADPYPLVLVEDGTKRIWHPLLNELVKGDGELQIVLMNGETVGTSAIIPTKVDRSLISNADHPASETPAWPVKVVQDVTEQADRAEAAVEHYPQIRNGVWYVWDATASEFVSTGISAQGEDGVSPTVTVEAIEGGHRVTITDADGAHTFDVMDGEGGSGSGAVESVNGQTGAVVLDADDVGALPNTYVAPVQSVNGMTGAVTIPTGDPNAVLYTPQTPTDAQQAQARGNIGAGTYTKPSGGIPASDLADGVIPDVSDKVDKITNYGLAKIESNEGNYTITVKEGPNSSTNAAVVSTGTFATAMQQAGQALAAKANTADVYTKTEIDNKGYQTAADVQTAISGVRQLPAVTASDNGKFLRVVSGAWAAQAVPAAESNSFGGGA